jgi:hypothetical protein
MVKKNGTVKARYCFPPSGSRKQASATVRRIDGRTIWSENLNILPDGSAEFSWNCKTLAAGVYLLTMRYGSNSVNGRFIIR